MKVSAGNFLRFELLGMFASKDDCERFLREFLKDSVNVFASKEDCERF